MSAAPAGGPVERRRRGTRPHMNLEEYIAARKDALMLLGTAVRSAEHSDLFRTTETYRAGGEGKEKTDRLLATVYSLLKDVMALVSGAPELVRQY